MMLEGLPTVFAYIVDMITAQRQKSSLAIAIHYLLEDVANAVDFATTHYLPLTLREPFLQNSSIGTPYQKWVKFTNEDFENVDRCLRRLIPAAWQWYDQTVDLSSHEEAAALKVAWGWLDCIFTEYVSVVINPDEPTITLSSINMKGWMDPLGQRFLNVWIDPSKDHPKQLPQVVTTFNLDIADRSQVTELQQTGRACLLELRKQISRLSLWLQDNYTMAELLAPHKGTLSDGSFWERPCRTRWANMPRNRWWFKVLAYCSKALGLS